MIEDSTSTLERTLQTALRARRRLRRGVRGRSSAAHRRASTTAKVEEFVVGSRARRRASGSCAATPPGSRTPPTSREAGLRDGRRGRGRRGPRRAPAAPRDVVALERRTVAPTARGRGAAGVGGEGPQGRGAASAPTTRPARESDSIRQVSATYADSRRRILIANSDGLLVEDDQVRTRFGVQCVAVGDTGMQTGFEAPGRTLGFELFDEIDPEEVARTAAARALTMLDARARRRAASCPSCCKRGAGGVLFHEACGHGLEADLVARTRRCSAARSASWSRRRSSRWSTTARTRASGARYAIDDEGAPAQRNVLIEDGVLTDYMWDLVRAAQARAREQRQRPARDLPAPADGAHDEHVPARRATTIPTTSSATPSTASTASRSAAVRSNTATGDFVFGITEAYMIEHGEITEPVRAAQLIGNGPETLRLRRRGRLRLRHLGRHLRQGRPGRPGVVGPADAAGRRAHRRRHRR